jgi:hypothetical protein
VVRREQENLAALAPHQRQVSVRLHGDDVVLVDLDWRLAAGVLPEPVVEAQLTAEFGIPSRPCRASSQTNASNRQLSRSW